MSGDVSIVQSMVSPSSSMIVTFIAAKEADTPVDAWVGFSLISSGGLSEDVIK